MGVGTIRDLANTLDPDSTIDQFKGVVESAEREDTIWKETARGLLRRNRGRGMAGKRYAGKPRALLLAEFDDHMTQVDKSRGDFCDRADGALERALALARGRRAVALHPYRDGESVPCFLLGHRLTQEQEKRRELAVEGESRSAKAGRVIATGDAERVAGELSSAIGSGDRDLAGSLLEGVAERWKKSTPGVIGVELAKLEDGDFFGIKALDARADALEGLRERVKALRDRGRPEGEGDAILDATTGDDATHPVGSWLE